MRKLEPPCSRPRWCEACQTSCYRDHNEVLCSVSVRNVSVRNVSVECTHDNKNSKKRIHQKHIAEPSQSFLLLPEARSRTAMIENNHNSQTITLILNKL